MVQISKLTKNEIKQTGFNNRSIAAKYMETVLHKKPKEIKKKEDLIKLLKNEYNKMKNFGIDLNETSQADRKIKKIEKTVTKGKKEIDNVLVKIINTAEKRKAEWEKFLIDNMDDEAVLEMSIDDYLKRIDYKIPKNIDYKHAYKKNISESIQELIVGKIKSKYYYKWQGIEEV